MGPHESVHKILQSRNFYHENTFANLGFTKFLCHEKFGPIRYIYISIYQRVGSHIHFNLYISIYQRVGGHIHFNLYISIYQRVGGHIHFNLYVSIYQRVGGPVSGCPRAGGVRGCQTGWGSWGGHLIPGGRPRVERARGERVGGRSTNTVQFIHFNLSEGRGSRQWVSEGRGGPWVSEWLGVLGGSPNPRGGPRVERARGGH